VLDCRTLAWAGVPAVIRTTLRIEGRRPSAGYLSDCHRRITQANPAAVLEILTRMREEERGGGGANRMIVSFGGEISAAAALTGGAWQKQDVPTMPYLGQATRSTATSAPGYK
jgi:hypothetical protein